MALLVRLLRYIRPREGWLITLLCTTAVLSLPVSLLLVGWVQGSGVLLGLTLLAMLVGFVLARSPFPGWLGGLLGVVFGLEATAGFVGHTLPPLRLVLDELTYAVFWSWPLAPLRGHGRAPLPFQALVSDVSHRLGSFGDRLWWWVQGVAAGGAQQDDMVFLFFVGLLVWAAGSWAVWWLHRRRQALTALLPVGVLLTVNVFSAGQGEWWLLVFLGCLTALLIAVRLASLEQRWARVGADYSGEIRVDTFLVGVLITTVVLGASVAGPAVVSRRTAEWIWRRFSKPWEWVDETAQRMFPQLERSASGAGPAGAGSLPRAHLLGGRPELSTQVVLRVWVNEPPPGQEGEQHYWRSRTYAVYNGQGWEQEELHTLERNAGEPWSEEPLVGRRELLQRVQVVGVAGRVLYAAGEPLAADHPYRALLRDAHDLAGLETVQRTGEYIILSTVPAVGEAALRAAGEAYPDWVLERYLQLRPLPERVTALAQELVAGIETPYDRAQALEAYLRTIPYTLDVKPPPEGRDVVDYFLFDLRQGYCDYYATAMVVLARSVGLPARLAVGYAPGRYDGEGGFFEVTGEQAHSWVEVYFPRYGWIPFEPTPARRMFERQGEGGQLTEELTDFSERLREPGEQGELDRLREAMRRLSLWLGIAATALAVGAAAWIIRRRRLEAGLGVAQRLYLRLTRWGIRLGRCPAAHETPTEFARGLAERLAVLATPVGWHHRLLQQSWLAGQEAKELTALFVQAQYSPHPLKEEKCSQAGILWRRLQPRLWTLWIVTALTPSRPGAAPTYEAAPRKCPSHRS
ncbi:MAG: DUF4129 domain-containing protein [Anaerolineae bacterium]|nr:DUF4129 domain-containing protein [Anaerolineae bacterium]